jgi:hypothetical protein
MMIERPIPHAIRRLCLTTSVLTWASFSYAGVEQCVDAHSHGQILRDDGKLLESQAEFLACATDEECPGPIRTECEQYLGSVKEMTPTVVFAARDTLGHDLDGVRVFLDGEFLTDADGSVPVPVNPGPHQMRFEHPSGQTFEQKLVCLPGEKARLVTAMFNVAPRTSDVYSTYGHTAQPSELRRISTYVFGGLAVVGLASFTYFGLSGKSEERSLRETCAPNCTGPQKQSVAEKYMLADVSLAVAGLSLAGGAILYFAPTPDNRGQTAGLKFMGEF